MLLFFFVALTGDPNYKTLNFLPEQISNMSGILKSAYLCHLFLKLHLSPLTYLIQWKHTSSSCRQCFHLKLKCWSKNSMIAPFSYDLLIIWLIMCVIVSSNRVLINFKKSLFSLFINQVLSLNIVKFIGQRLSLEQRNELVDNLDHLWSWLVWSACAINLCRAQHNLYGYTILYSHTEESSMVNAKI